MTLEYKVVTAISGLDLNQRVNSNMADGYQCQGGVSVCVGEAPGCWIYAQAMVREVYVPIYGFRKRR